jgi:hypothetical protein
MSSPTTTPIPAQGRHPAPNPAPNKPTECPRCGAPAISTRGVALHDLWHREQDLRHRKLDALIEALEEMLSAFDGDPDEHGDRKTFRDWVAETDQILDRQQTAIEQLSSPSAEAADPDVEVLPWPGDPAPLHEVTLDEPTAGDDWENRDEAVSAAIIAGHAPQPTAIDAHLAARTDDLDDGDDYVDAPGSRY